MPSTVEAQSLNQQTARAVPELRLLRLWSGPILVSSVCIQEQNTLLVHQDIRDCGMH